MITIKLQFSSTQDAREAGIWLRDDVGADDAGGRDLGQAILDQLPPELKDEEEMNDTTQDAALPHNPWPNVTDVAPTWINWGVSYNTARYDDEEAARKVSQHLKAGGGTVNGGYLHGTALGALESHLTNGQRFWDVRF